METIDSILACVGEATHLKPSSTWCLGCRLELHRHRLFEEGARHERALNSVLGFGLKI